MKKLLLAALLASVASPAAAQNVTCPTRPLGDSSNACASTAFVQQNVGVGAGVTSIGGMNGVIACGPGLTCAGGVIDSLGGSGGVTSVSSADSSLNVFPSTGAVNVVLNTDHANTWTETQFMTNQPTGVSITYDLGFISGAEVGMLVQNTNGGGRAAYRLFNDQGVLGLVMATGSLTNPSLGNFSVNSLNVGTPAANPVTLYTNNTPRLTVSGAGAVALPGISGSVQCLHVNSAGTITGTGSDCGSGSSPNLLPLNNVWTGTNNFTLNTGIGTNLAPDSPLTVSANASVASAGLSAGTNAHIVGADGAANILVLDAFANQDVLLLRRANGTNAAKLSLNANDNFGVLTINGWDSTALSYVAGGGINFIANENWGASAHGTMMNFRVVPNGTTAVNEVARITGVGLGINISPTTPASPDSLLTVNANTGPSFVPQTLGPLHLVGADGSNARVTVDAYGGGANLLMQRANGSNTGTHSPLIANDLLSAYNTNGYDGSTYATGPAIAFRASENWSTTNHGSEIRFLTGALGSSGVTEVMRIQASGGLSVGSANVTADGGNGVIRASALQIANFGGVALWDSTSSLFGALNTGATGHYTILSAPDHRPFFQARDSIVGVPDDHNWGYLDNDVLQITNRANSVNFAQISASGLLLQQGSLNVAAPTGTAITVTGPSGNGFNTLDISQTWATQTSTNVMEALTAYGDVSRLVLRQAGGSQGSPLATSPAGGLGAINFRGYNGTTFTGNVANINVLPLDTFSSSATGASMSFGVTPTGTTAIQTVMLLQNNQVGVGLGAATTPDALFTVNANTATASFAPVAAGTNVHIIGADSATNALTMDGYNSFPIVAGRRVNGSMTGTRTGLNTNDTILNVSMSGWDGTAVGSSGGMRFLAGETWNSGAHGSFISFFVVANGTPSVPEQMRLYGSGGLTVGNANLSFVDPGSGFVRATGYAVGASAGANCASGLGATSRVVNGLVVAC